MTETLGIGMEAYEKWVLISADEQLSLSDRHQAFGELVHLFQDMAYSVAYGTLDDFHLAQDAVQESFVIAYRQLNQFIHQRRVVGVECIARHYQSQRFHRQALQPHREQFIAIERLPAEIPRARHTRDAETEQERNPIRRLQRACGH
jgi:DNA-directed RNA polymerase specialized sigma24 family protein